LESGVNVFKDKPERLMFEIINEPLGMSVSEVDDVMLGFTNYMKVKSYKNYFIFRQ
jgi:hypothetical protein